MQLIPVARALFANYFRGAGLLLVLAVLCLSSGGAAQQPQEANDGQAREERVRLVLQNLEPNNRLGYALERGDRGSGPHYAWMDQMRDQEIGRASCRERV